MVGCSGSQLILHVSRGLGNPSVHNRSTIAVGDYPMELLRGVPAAQLVGRRSWRRGQTAGGGSIPRWSTGQPQVATRRKGTGAGPKKTPWNFYDDRQSTHERTLRGGRLRFLVHSVCLTTVSLSFHPHLFHTPGISMRSMCIGACHACTASHCDLRDPGWGIPGFGIATFLLGTCRLIR